MKNSYFTIIVSILAVLLKSSISWAASTDNLLNDINGDGIVSVVTFGDSITYGIGDGGLGLKAKAGYPKRAASILGVPFSNQGNPGEQIADASSRFFSAVKSSNADIVILLEGANDATQQLAAGEYRKFVQRFINGTISLGKVPVVMTLPLPCCDHASLQPFTAAYSETVKSLAKINQIHFVDLERAWKTTCKSIQCELYNLPEGLHPTSNGYTVIAQAVSSELLGIDIFSLEGASKLESAAGLPQGSVIVKPGT